jgi:excisionase family DNA binding protein
MAMMETLNLEQAAKFMHLHPDTLQRMAKRGEVPACKTGKRWVFIDVDLVAYIRSNYAPLVSQGVHEKEKSCRSLAKQGRSISGVSSISTANVYKDLLGLPTA